jgi:beta-xylosidase
VGRARDIRGPYEWRTVLEPGTTPIQGPHQGGYVETPNGMGWFLHFNSTGAFGRIVHMQPVKWVDDWPVMGRPIPGRQSGQPVLTYAAPLPNDPATRLQASDEFTTAKLGLQWSWNHNPDDSRWSLTKRPGWLRLEALPAEHLVTARNTLTQILQGPAMRITARIDVSHMAEGQRAGLSLFGVRPSWIGVALVSGKRVVTFANEGGEGPQLLRPESSTLRQPPFVAAATVDLRAEVDADQIVRYSYSLDGGKSFRPYGQPEWLARFSWWKGSRPALFTFTRGQGRGWIDVDWVHVEVQPH